MPTYEYRCPDGHEFEKFFRTISAAAGEHPCPTCGAIGVRQLSGGAGLMFKGSGFYLTDYGKNAHANKGTAPKGGGDASGAPGESSPAGDGRSGGSETAGATAAGASKPETPAASSGGGGDSGSASSAPKPKSGE